MAEVNALGDLTKCPICFNVFVKPRCLPCLHTFCEKCLQQFINGTDIKEKTNILCCPTCRRAFNVPDDGGFDSDKIAEYFPINHLIVTLMDYHLVLENKNVCGPCQKRSIVAEPISWCTECKTSLCQQCLEYHSALPVLETHRLGPLGDAQRMVDAISSSSLLCKFHPDKRLEMYCEDHELPCCLTCTMIEHRKCEKVDTLESASKSLKATRLKKEVELKLNSELKEINEHLESRKAEEKCLLEDCDEMKISVESTTEQMIVHLKVLSTQAIQEISNLKEKQHSIICSDIKVTEERKRTIENYQKLLYVSKDNLSKEHFFLEAKRFMQCFDQEFESGYPKQLKRKNLKFETASQVLSLLKEKSIGTIVVSDCVDVADEKKNEVRERELDEVEYLKQGEDEKTKDIEDETVEKKKDDLDVSNEKTESTREESNENNSSPLDKGYSQLQCQSLKTVKLDTLKSNSAVYNCLFLDDGRLVTVDYKVHTSKDGIIKIFDNDYVSCDTISIRGKPWDATALNTQVLAITIPSRNELCFLDILTFRKRYQKCDRKYFGVALKDTLAFSENPLEGDMHRNCNFFLSSKQDVFLRSMTGETLLQLHLSTSYVSYIRYCQGRIYYSDGHSLGCLDLNGDFIYKHHLRCSSGIAYYKPNDQLFAFGENLDCKKCLFIIDKDGKIKADESWDSSVFSTSVLAFNSTYDKLCMVDGGVDGSNIAFIFFLGFNAPIR